MKKFLIFIILMAFTAFQSEAQDTTTAQNNYFLEFVKKVYFNPTVFLRTQNFRESTKVRALVLPDLNGSEANTITGFEKAMQKIIRFLIEGDDKGSVRFYFDMHNGTAPFSFVPSDELKCKFRNADVDSITKRLNAPFAGANFNLNSHILFETAIDKALNYISVCLQNNTFECGDQADNQTTEINTKPLSIGLYNTTGSKFDVDVKQFTQLESFYAKAYDVFTQQDWYAPAKVLVSGADADEPMVLALNRHESLFKKENLMIKVLYNNSVLPVLAGSTNDSIRFKIPKDLPVGNPVEVVVTYKSPVDSMTYTVGFFMVQVMEKQTIKVNLVAANGFNLAGSKAQIEAELKKIYDPVGITFEIAEKSLIPESDWKTTIEIGSSGLLSNYPPDLRDWVNGVQDIADYDKDEYYLVYGLSTSEQLGYMPRARNIGFIFSGASNLGETSAHELGHGIFHLRHIFADEELGANGMYGTRNVMDYKDGETIKLRDLYAHQWQFIADPAFVSWFSGDDEEALSANMIYSAIDDTTTSTSLSPASSAMTSIYLGGLDQDIILKISEDQYVKFKASEVSDKTAVFYGEVIIRFESNGLQMKPTGSSYTTSKEKVAYYNGPSSVFFCESCSDRTYNIYTHSDTKKEIKLIAKYSPNDILPVFVDCENVPGYYYPENSQLVIRYPVCPPSGQIALKDPDEMPIPHNWKFTDADGKRCVSFVCPDKRIIKLDVNKIKKARFTAGLKNDYNLETLADGFLSNFVYDNGSGEKTYKAKIENQVFKGYVCNSEMFEDYLPLKDNEFAVMLLPFGVERIPYKIKYWGNASAYSGRGSTKVVEVLGSDLTLSAEGSHFMNLKLTAYSNHIERIGTETYYLDESKYGMNTYGASVFDYLSTSDYSKINDFYWFISKISQLKSKYPLLYPRMTKRGLLQWDGWTEVATYTTLVTNMGSIALNWIESDTLTNNPVESYFLTTDGLVAGYFDYIYTEMGWGDFTQNPKEKFYLGKFYKYFKRLVRANKLLSQEYINTIKSEDCTGSKTASIYHNGAALNTTQIYNAISSMSVAELEGLCNTTRTRLIRHLIYPGMENMWLVTNGLEKIVIHILDNTPEIQQADLLNNLCTVKYDDELLIQTMADAIDDETCFWGDDYFSEMVKWVTKAYSKYQGNQLKNRYETNQCTQSDLETLKKRICVYNYAGFVKRLGKGIWYTVCSDLGLTSAGPNPVSDFLVPNPDKMTEVEFTPNDQIKFKNYSEMCFSNVGTAEIRYLDPMEPVFIDDKGNLMDAYSETKGVLMPAVALYFIEQAAESRTTVAIIQTVVDVATFIIPGAGPIKLLTYADKLSTVASLTSAYFEDDNPQLAQTLGIFSAVLGFADFANTPNVAAKFEKFQDFSTNSQKALISVKASNMSSVSQESKLDNLLKKFEDNDPELMAALADNKSKEFAKRALVVEESAAISNPAIKSRIRKVINSLDNLGPYANHSFYSALSNKLSSYWGKTQTTVGKLYKKANSTQSADLVAEITTQGDLVIYQNKVATTWSEIRGSECVDILPASSYKLKNGTTLSGDQLSDLTIYRKNNELICTTTGNCFPAGTKVILGDGRVIDIQNIQVGDVVASFQESNQTFTNNKVVQLFKRTTTQLTRIVTTKDTIWATPEHPFYTAKGWINAGALVSGALLQTVNGQIPVTAAHTIDSNCVVYNFEVENTHTYLIGNGAYLVHNTCAYRKQLLDDGLDPAKVTRLQELESTNAALYAQIKEANLSVSKVSDFLDDFGTDAVLLSKFENGTTSVKSWEALAESSILRKDLDALTKMTSLQKKGLTYEQVRNIGKIGDKKAIDIANNFTNKTTELNDGLDLLIKNTFAAVQRTELDNWYNTFGVRKDLVTMLDKLSTTNKLEDPGSILIFFNSQLTKRFDNPGYVAQLEEAIAKIDAGSIVRLESGGLDIIDVTNLKAFEYKAFTSADLAKLNDNLKSAAEQLSQAQSINNYSKIAKVKVLNSANPAYSMSNTNLLANLQNYLNNNLTNTVGNNLRALNEIQIVNAGGNILRCKIENNIVILIP